MMTDVEVPTRGPLATHDGSPLRERRAAEAADGRHADAYRRDIDGLRAVAVLAVVAFHAFPARFRGGFVGVDVFFVISGYLISGLISKQLAEGRFSFADFYARRMKRILPALLVVLAACYAFGWFTLLPEAYAQLCKHIAAGMAFVSNFALWSEAGYFDASAASKPLLHLWSLGIEEQFYLVWPLALWCVARWRRGALVLIVAVGAVSFLINLATVRHAPVAAFYSPLSRFWELQLGCLLAALTQNANRRAMPPIIADALAIAGALMLGFAILFLNDKMPYPGRWALLPTCGTFALIASGPESWFARNVLSRPVLVGVGLVSYPLYLWHWPLLSFASISALGTPSVGVRVAAVLASGVLAVATYFFVEKPVRFGAARRFKIPALAALSLLSAAVGYATYRLDGAPTRFPLEIRTLAAFKYEYKTDARYPECWLSSLQPFDGFAPNCIDTSAGRPRVVVWGDSHAARLYPGLKAVFGDTIAFSQFTRDGCPPVLDFRYEMCRKSNAWIVGEIARIRPETVIVFGVWPAYETDWESPAAKGALLATIDALHQAGVGKVVVMGPEPLWKGGLPTLLYQAWQQGHPFHVVPERLATGLDPAPPIVEQKLRNDLAGREVTYFSVRDVLCNDQGCLTHTPEGAMHLITWDYGHLTTDGATLVARQLAAERVLP